MTPAALEALAHEAVAAGFARVTFTFPPGWRPPRLLRFPRYELLSVNPAGEKNVSVDAARLLQWCVEGRLL